MKKMTALVLLLALTLTLFACGSKEPTKLGTSAFSIVLPNGYELAEDDLDEDQVAYFYKDDKSIDFDVYQWKKGNLYTLATEASYFAATYGVTAEAVTINDIDGWKYVTAEEFDGKTYTVVNYMFEDDTYIVEICFWTVDTKAEYKAVDKIINTLEKN